MAENPYAAPAAAVADVAPEGEYILADRGSRLGAAILDGLLAIPLYFLFIYVRQSKVIPSGAVLAGVTLYAVLLAVVNLVLLYRNGQGIGKKIVGIKIVRKNGERASLARIFWLRIVVNAIPGMVPYIGWLYGLTDTLFIFGEPHRCVHDYIADTVVIKA
ncbi:MAG TPA: RDD family protein [Gammaproteobacteria bacterium]|jgi:uncharacterized RDD family membrane protein YckC